MERRARRRVATPTGETRAPQSDIPSVGSPHREISAGKPLLACGTLSITSVKTPLTRHTLLTGMREGVRKMKIEPT